MSRFILHSLLLTLLMSFCATSYAQRPEHSQYNPNTPSGIKAPDLHTSDAGFFDPTRVEKKREVYNFGVDWRLEIGYVQNHQYSLRTNFPDAYLHGGNIGFKVDFLLPLHFSIQTGAAYSFAYGRTTQRWGTLQDEEQQQKEYFINNIYEHTLLIPVRAYYTVYLPKKWRLLFFGGPQMQIGLAQPVVLQSHVSDKTLAWLEQRGVKTQDHARYSDDILRRFTIQIGVGGGVEWDRIRLTAGYDFGLNNLVKTKVISDQHMWEWSWFVNFGVRLNKKEEQQRKQDADYFL